jgi:hypothetical protein
MMLIALLTGACRKELNAPGRMNFRATLRFLALDARFTLRAQKGATPGQRNFCVALPPIVFDQMMPNRIGRRG